MHVVQGNILRNDNEYRTSGGFKELATVAMEISMQNVTSYSKAQHRSEWLTSIFAAASEAFLCSSCDCSEPISLLSSSDSNLRRVSYTTGYTRQTSYN